MEYKCIKDMIYNDFPNEVGFKKGKIYTCLKMLSGTRYMVDEMGDSNEDFSDEWLEEFFITAGGTTTVYDDIIINTVSFPIEEILIPTQSDISCDYLLKCATETIVELWEDRDIDLKHCDRIGIYKEDIPLLIKGLEKIYDEYMDAQNK